jgi:multidrug efflux system membrane fusion protein
MLRGNSISLAPMIFSLLLAGCVSKKVEVEPPASRPAKLYTVKHADEMPPRRYPAVVEAIDRIDLSFKVGGALIELNVKQGQEVKKGDLLARIDPRDYELALSRARSQLEATQAQEQAMKVGARPEDIRILEAKVQAAKTQYDRDERFFQERKGLVEKGAITRQSLETFESASKISKANLETAIKELEKGKVGARKEDIEAIEAKVRDLKQNVADAQNSLDDTKLIAPFSGRVIDRFVDNFQDVQAKQKIVNLQLLDFIKLNFGLPEGIVFNLERGNLGSFSAVFNGLPDKEFPVNIREARLEADPKTRTFPCWVEMPVPKGAIVLPGMNAEIIHRNPREARPGFPVPSTALIANESKQYFVWKVDPAEMIVHKMPVEAGPLSGEDIWVNKGLKDGDLIVAAGANYLNEGEKVSILETKD